MGTGLNNDFALIYSIVAKPALTYIRVYIIALNKIPKSLKRKLDYETDFRSNLRKCVFRPLKTPELFNGQEVRLIIYPKQELTPEEIRLWR